VWASSALEYQPAARAQEAGSPDPRAVLDRAHAIVPYEVPHLPSGNHESARANRKGQRPPDVVDQLFAIAAMALLGVAGIIIGWVLLAL
jgi:hypothetical protein